MKIRGLLEVVAKNVFEKLGLIEAVEEKNNIVQEPEKEVSEDEMLSNYEMLSDDEMLSSGVDSFDDEILKEIDEVVVEKEKEMDMEQKKIDKNNIENKLDALIGSYEKNKLLSIDDIYKNARLTLNVKKSIFMVDILNKTLPENLPIDIKRETVLSLMEISELDKDSLLNDAYERIDSLNTVLEETVDTTENILNKNKMTISELKRRIAELESINDERHEFQKDQNTLVEYEIEKVINLVNFVKPKK
jgi:hypothetical protein